MPDIDDVNNAIAQKIFILRGQKVMLDRDLALLFSVKPIRLREQVKRNSKRFPGNFVFRLTEKEAESMVSHFAIPSKKHLGGSLPLAFTEHGILQLANVLKSEIAANMSIQIIEVFVKMRELILSKKDLLLKMQELEKRFSNQDKKIQIIFDYLKQFINEQDKPRNRIGF